MTFLNQLIDNRVTRDCDFYVEHPSRKKNYAAGGNLVQTFGDSPPKHFVNLSYGIKTRAQYSELYDAFYVVLFTPYTGLLAQNPADYLATATNTTLTNTTGTLWQLQRKHVFGGITLKRNIKKPASGVLIYNASNVLLTATVNTDTGIADVTGTPAYWVGTFYLPMTFKDNVWKARMESSQNGGLVVPEPIMMEEVLNP
jgi:hypothetical protein